MHHALGASARAIALTTARTAALTTTLLALTLATPALAQDGKKETALVVPFGVSTVDDVKLAAALTASTERIASSAHAVTMAKAPLVDILTLIECPSGEDSCVGTLADALGVDVALTGRIVSRSAGAVADLRIIKRDGTITRLVHLLTGSSQREKVRRFEVALASKLGGTPATVASPQVSATTNGTPEPEGLFDDTTTGSDVSNATVPTAPEAPASPASTAATGQAPFSSSTPSPGYRDAGGKSAGLGGVRPIAWATTGGGVVALIVGSVFLNRSSATQDEVERAPTQSQEDLRALQELEDRGDRQKTTGGVFLTVGALATATGLGLILWDSTRPASDESTQLTVFPQPDGATVAISGRF